MTTSFSPDYQPAPSLLENNVILVTGAAEGIGKAVAVDAAKHGATVVILDKTVGKLEQVYDEIVDAGHPEPAIYPLDLETATWDDYQALASNLKEQLGGLDGLVLNAAWVGAPTPFTQTDIQTYLKVITVNLHSPFLSVKALMPLLQEAHSPSIVISTHDANRAYQGGFGMAKAGLRGMLDILADEYNVEHKPVRVNGIDTGPVNTAQRRFTHPGEDWSQHPLPEAVSNAYLFYLGDDAKAITGENLEMAALRQS